MTEKEESVDNSLCGGNCMLCSCLILFSVFPLMLIGPWTCSIYIDAQSLLWLSWQTHLLSVRSIQALLIAWTQRSISKCVITSDMNNPWLCATCVKGKSWTLYSFESAHIEQRSNVKLILDLITLPHWLARKVTVLSVMSSVRGRLQCNFLFQWICCVRKCFTRTLEEVMALLVHQTVITLWLNVTENWSKN